MAKDYSKKMKQSALIQQTEEYMDNEVFGNSEQPEQGRAEAPVPQPQPDPTPYGEVLKNVGAKIPYSVYEGLERIKRQSERTGNKADKRSIGDLVAQAIKEFVERNGVG